MTKAYIKRFFAVLSATCIMACTFGSCHNTNGGSPTGDINKYIDYEHVNAVDSGMQWPEGQIFPSMASPAENLDLVNIGSLGKSRQLAVITLQGIVNRNKPGILTSSGSTLWFEKLELSTERISATEAIEKYLSEISGVIVYDSEQPHTINLACTLAGQKNAIVTDSVFAQKLTEAPYNLEIIEDYTGDFEDKLQVYNYMYDNLWQDCDKRLFAGINPDICDAYRDMGVAAKSAFIYLDPTIAEEAEVLSKFAKDCKPGETYYAGWWPKNEFGGLELFGKQYGICTISTDFFRNMSVLAGMSKNINMKAIPDLPDLENKIYVACMFSEGDNLQYDQNAMFDLWNDPQRGEIPITWSIAPALYDAGPGMLNYYYSSATDNDCFITGPSGGAFILSETWTDEEWIDRFTKMTDKYCRYSGIRLGNVWNYLIDPIWSSYGENCRFLWGVTEISHHDSMPEIPTAGYLTGVTLVPGYASFQKSYDSIMNEVNRKLREFDGSAPEFIFAQGMTWETDISDFIRFREDLEEKYGEDNVVFVRGDHLVLLMQQYNGFEVNVSGSYINKSVTVSASSNSENAEKTVDSLYSTENDLWVGDGSKEQWITLDLGGEKSISRYVIMHAGAAKMDKSYNTKGFKVQMSSDGKSWKDVSVFTENTSDVSDVDLKEPFTARYVRVLVTDGGTDGIARIGEIELYGK